MKKDHTDRWIHAVTQHQKTVRNHLKRFCRNLLIRGMTHDNTKLESPEIEGYATTLSGVELAEISKVRPALEHHYAENRHHPEFFGVRGVSGMTLIDLVEMTCDWVASAQRDKNDPLKWLKDNTERFNLSPQLATILHNTIVDFTEEYPPE